MSIRSLTSTLALKSGRVTTNNMDSDSDRLRFARAEFYEALHLLFTLIDQIDKNRGLLKVGDDGKVQAKNLLNHIDADMIKDNSLENDNFADNSITAGMVRNSNIQDRIDYAPITKIKVDPNVFTNDVTDIENSTTDKIPLTEPVKQYLRSKVINQDLRGTLYITSWQAGIQTRGQITSGNHFTYNDFGVKNVADHTGIGDPCAIVGVEFDNYVLDVTGRVSSSNNKSEGQIKNGETLTKLKQDNGGVTDVNLSQHHSFRVRFYYCKVEV